MPDDLKSKLESLLIEVVDELRNRMKSKEARPADISNAIKLLHDNGIQVLAKPGNPLQGLLDDMNELPFKLPVN
jgi:hypothetical protein